MALNQVHDRDGIIGSGPRAGSKGCPELHRRSTASCCMSRRSPVPSILAGSLSTVINGAGRYEPVHDDQIVLAQFRDERLKSVLDAEASLEVLRPRLQLRSYGQP